MWACDQPDRFVLNSDWLLGALRLSTPDVLGEYANGKTERKKITKNQSVLRKVKFLKVS